MKSKKTLIGLGIGLVIIIILGVILFNVKSKPANGPTPTPTLPPPPVNVIPVSERPFVSLQPLSGRNDLEFTVSNLKKQATEVEVALEYDRNKGVWDAVLKQFMLSKLPFTDKIFLGSKSAGGSITYHDDVVGGKIKLKFTGGEERYALEVPWFYNDTKKEFSEISTQDAKFQVKLAKPLKSPKIVVMQSPGLPGDLDGTVVAGPYLIRTVGDLPEIKADLQIRLNEDSPDSKLFGWDGTAWQPIEAKVDGKSLTATSNMYLAWVVVK